MDPVVTALGAPALWAVLILQLGFMTVATGIFVFEKVSDSHQKRQQTSNLEAERVKESHDHRAADEQLAAMAMKGFDFALNPPTAQQRAMQLSNGGPHEQPGELLLLTLKTHESIGELRAEVRAVADDLSQMKPELRAVSHGMGQIRPEIVEIKQRLEDGDSIFAQLPCRIGKADAGCTVSHD